LFKSNIILMKDYMQITMKLYIQIYVMH